MKVIKQICYGNCEVFGIGDDNKVYFWSRSKGKWILYAED